MSLRWHALWAEFSCERERRRWWIHNATFQYNVLDIISPYSPFFLESRNIFVNPIDHFQISSPASKGFSKVGLHRIDRMDEQNSIFNTHLINRYTSFLSIIILSRVDRDSALAPSNHFPFQRKRRCRYSAIWCVPNLLIRLLHWIAKPVPFHLHSIAECSVHLKNCWHSRHRFRVVWRFFCLLTWRITMKWGAC